MPGFISFVSVCHLSRSALPTIIQCGWYCQGRLDLPLLTPTVSCRHADRKPRISWPRAARRDKTEEPMELSEEERNKLVKKESSRLLKTGQRISYSPRKEKALKIYLDGGPSKDPGQDWVPGSPMGLAGLPPPLWSPTTAGMETSPALCGWPTLHTEG